MNALTNLKSKTKSIGNKLGQLKDKAFLATCGVTAAIVTVTPAHAAGVVDDLFTAFDLTGLSTKITALLTIGVAITLGYAAYRHLKKAGSKV